LIETPDAEQVEITEKMAEATFYQQDKETIAATTKRHAEIEQELKAVYIRWEQLEEIQ